MRRLLATAGVVLAVAGCGSDGPGKPEELVPASSLGYAHVTLKPEGSQKEGVDALLRKLPGNPRSELQRLLQRAFRESDSGLSYERDVKPWLGDEAAVFFSTPRAGRDKPDALALIATEDEDKAQEAVAKANRGKRTTERSYEGVDYRVTRDGEAVATIDGFLASGTEPALRQAVDVSRGDARPLSESEAFKRETDNAPDDRLATFFLNTPRLRDALRDTIGSSAAGAFDRYLRDPYLGTLRVDAEGADFSSTLPPAVASFFAPFLGKGADLIESLPGDAWAAGAQPEVGKTIDQYVNAFAAAAGGREVIEQQLRSQTGLDLNHDIIGWMGDLGFFVRGETERSVNGALAIETDDPAASRRALAALRPRLNSGDARTGPLTAPGGGDGFTVRDASVPQPVHIFQRGGRVVIAYGDAAARDAVEASETLGDSDGFKSARESLGGEYDVSTFVLTAPIVRLAEASGASSDPDWARAKPYLEAIGAIVAGTKEQGDRVESRTRITVP